MDLKLLSAGDDLKIWDCSDFILTRQFNPHDQNITSACWAWDNSFLASVSMHTENVVITNATNFENTQLHTGPGCMCIDINDTSRYMLSGASDGIISVWDLKSNKIRKTYKGHKGPVTCARFNQGSSAIASGSETGEIIIYNVVTGQGCRPLVAPNVQAIKQVQFSRHKKSLFGSVSDDGSVNLWDANRRQLVHSFTCHRAPTTGLSFSPINDIFLISVGLDKRIACHDVQSKKVVKIMNADSPLTSVDTKQDGFTVAVGSTRGKIYHYDLRMSSVPVRTLDAHKSSVQCLRFQMELKNEHSNKTASAVKPQMKITGRQLPPSPRENIENTAPVQDLRPAGPSIGEDVFSPLREGYQDQSSEEMDYKSIGNITQNARNDTGDNFSVGVFSPINEAVGRASGSGIGLSPLAYSSYPLSEQNRNSPGIMDYNRINSQNSLPSLKIEHPSTNENTDADHSYNAVTNHLPVSDHLTAETTPSGHVSQSDIQSSKDQSAGQRHVAFNTDQDSFAFLTPSTAINGDHSPELKRQRQAHHNEVGMSASPQFPSMHLNESSGSAHGSTEVSPRSKSTTPEGVNPQSSVPNTYDYQQSSRKENRVTKIGGKMDSKVLNGDLGQLAEVIRTMVQEELSDLKNDIRRSLKDEVDDMVDQLHRDIINLQAEMLIQFQLHQTEMLHLLAHYSVNQDLVAEVQRLQEENKRLKKNF